MRRQQADLLEPPFTYSRVIALSAAIAALVTFSGALAALVALGIGALGGGSSAVALFILALVVVWAPGVVLLVLLATYGDSKLNLRYLARPSMPVEMGVLAIIYASIAATFLIRWTDFDAASSTHWWFLGRVALGSVVAGFLGGYIVHITVGLGRFAHRQLRNWNSPPFQDWTPKDLAGWANVPDSYGRWGDPSATGMDVVKARALATKADIQGVQVALLGQLLGLIAASGGGAAVSLLVTGAWPPSNWAVGLFGGSIVVGLWSGVLLLRSTRVWERRAAGYRAYADLRDAAAVPKSSLIRRILRPWRNAL